MILLNKDGTFKVSNNIDKLQNKSNVEYVMFDNSTALKKDVFSIVKYNKIDFSSKKIYLDYDLQFCDVDMIFTDYDRLKTHLKITKLDQKYNIYPLICQLMTFTAFGYECLDTLFHSYLENVDIRIGDNIYSFDCDTDDIEINKLFNILKLRTHMSKIFDHDEVIIFDKKEWSKVRKREIPNKFDQIGLPIDGCENIIVMPRYDYKLLKKVDKINISIDFFDNERNMQEDDISFSYYLSISHFNGLLQLFIFVPQLIEVCKAVYKRRVTVTMQIVMNKKEVECRIPWRNVKDGICIYPLIMNIINEI